MDTSNAPHHQSLFARLWRQGVAVFAVLVTLAPCAKAQAADCPSTSRWTDYRTPSHEDLCILPGSDISAFDIAAEGDTVYAIGMWNPPDNCIPNSYSDENIAAGQAPRFWRSTDSGASWTDLTERVLQAMGLPDCGDNDIDWDDFVFFSAMSAAPDDKDFIAISGYDAMQRAVIVASNDGGDSFHYTGCGQITGEPLCIDISVAHDGIRTAAVGTLDLISGGSVWLFDFGAGLTGAWHDSGNDPGWADEWQLLGDTATRSDIYAVPSIVFSPTFESDSSLLATVVAYAEEPDGDAYTGFYVAQGRRHDGILLWNRQAGYDEMPVKIAAGGTVIATDETRPSFFLRQAALLAPPSDYHADHEDRRAILLAVNGKRRDVASGATVDEGGFLYILRRGHLSGDLLRHERNPFISSITYAGRADMSGKALLGCLLPAPYAWEWRWTPELQDWHADKGDHDDGDHVLGCCSGPVVLLSDSLDDCCPQWTPADQSPSGQLNCQVAFAPDGERAYASTEGDSRHGRDDLHWGDESGFSISTGSRPGLSWEQTGLVDTMIDATESVNFDPQAGCLYVHTSHDSPVGSVCSCESVWRTCDEGETYRRVLLGRPDVSKGDKDAFDDVMDDYHRGFFSPRSSGYAYGDRARYAIGDAVEEDDQAEYGFEANAVYRRLEDGGGWEIISDFTLDYEGLLLMECDDCAVPVLYAGFNSLWWDFTTNEPLPYLPDGSAPLCPPGHDCRKVSGVARCLAPDREGCCSSLEWDYLIRGLEGTEDEDGAWEQLSLSGGHCAADGVQLWAFDDGNRYWAEQGGDSTNFDWCEQEFVNDAWGRLWIYVDCLAFAVPQLVDVTEEGTLQVVPCDSCFCENDEYVIPWTRPCDACKYEIEVATDPDFRHITLRTEDFVDNHAMSSSARFYLPANALHPSAPIRQGILDCNKTYWWRVRARVAETGEVIRSWWSETAVFRTAPPQNSLQLHSPGPGATCVPIDDVAFTWSRVPGASSYDFMLVDTSRGHVASLVGDSTAIVVPGPLKYDTSYFWRVLALDGETVISGSVEATFRTRAAPSQRGDVDIRPSVVLPRGPGVPVWMPYLAGTIAGLLVAAMFCLSLVNRRLRRSETRLRVPRSRRPQP